jgi:hypothetical protein
MKKVQSQERLSKLSGRGVTLLGLGAAAMLSACGSEAPVDAARAGQVQQVQVDNVRIDEPGLAELMGGGVQAQVEVAGPWVEPHVQDFANAVCNRFNACRPSTYDGHPTRGASLALDILVSGQWGDPANEGDGLGKGWDVARYALADHDGRFRVDYVIWQGRINYKDGTGWHNYPNQGSVTGNHLDHVHVSFRP